MKTPQYIVSRKSLQENYMKLDNLLSNCKLHYVLKTNAAIPILESLNICGCSFECASINEFEILKEIGVSNSRIICGAVIKTDQLIRCLYSQGCRYFVFDDYMEFEKLIHLAPDAKRVLRIDVGEFCTASISLGMNRALLFSKEIYNNKDNIDGVTFHISDNTNIEILSDVLKYVENLLCFLRLPTTKKFILNIGGSYSFKVNENFYKILTQRLQYLKDRYNLILYAEPGLAIVNSACRYYTKVIRVRNETELCKDVFIEGGYPDGVIRSPGNVNIFSRPHDSKKNIYRFYDLTSIHTQLFIKRVSGTIVEGDILEFTDYGAYTYVYQNSFHMYNKPIITIRDYFPDYLLHEES